MKSAAVLLMLAGCAGGYTLDGDTSPVVAFEGARADARVLYLHWSDGSAPSWPAAGDACGGLTPTPSTAPPDFRAAVLDQLNVWYADFGVTWTDVAGPAGPRYEVVVSNGPGTWCGLTENIAGMSPFSCHTLHKATSHVFARADLDAHDIATAVAHEQAHQFGLTHVDSPLDVMDPYVSADAVGFIDQAIPVSGAQCGRATQNGHAMMLAAVGARP